MVDVFQFVLFSVLACPPNYIWQSWLEAQFPAYTDGLCTTQKEALVDKAVSGKTIDTGEDGHVQPEPEPKTMAQTMNAGTRLNKKNTIVKILLDQLLGSPINNILFIAGIALIRGQTSEVIQADIADRLWPTTVAGLRLWPVVSILNFTLVPLEYRMLVGAVAGLFWGIYLSLVAGSG